MTSCKCARICPRRISQSAVVLTGRSLPWASRSMSNCEWSGYEGGGLLGGWSERGEPARPELWATERSVVERRPVRCSAFVLVEPASTSRSWFAHPQGRSYRIGGNQHVGIDKHGIRGRCHHACPPVAGIGRLAKARHRSQESRQGLKWAERRPGSVTYGV